MGQDALELCCQVVDLGLESPDVVTLETNQFATHRIRRIQREHAAGGQNMSKHPGFALPDMWWRSRTARAHPAQPSRASTMRARRNNGRPLQWGIGGSSPTAAFFRL